jgi:hypothetical protein
MMDPIGVPFDKPIIQRMKPNLHGYPSCTVRREIIDTRSARWWVAVGGAGLFCAELLSWQPTHWMPLT